MDTCKAAFEQIEHLPARERLVVCRAQQNGSYQWFSGSVADVARLAPEVDLFDAVVAYEKGTDKVLFASIFNSAEGTVALIAGAESTEQMSMLFEHAAAQVNNCGPGEQSGTTFLQ